MEALRAILVDDELYTRLGLKKLIDWESCGFRIVGEADNGEDALELIASLSPDLVVTDIRMPVMDGLELIRRAAARGMNGTSFVIFSGYDDFKYAQQAVRYGVHDYLLKPIDEAELAQTLRRLRDWIRRERAQRAEREKAKEGLSGAAMEALILGELDGLSEAEWRRRLSLGPCSELRYALAELNDRHPWREPPVREVSPAQFKEWLKQALADMTGSGDPDEGAPYCLHEHRNRVGILLTDRLLAPFGGDVERFGMELKRRLVEDGDDAWLYVGRPVRELSHVRHSYETARQTLQYKFAVGGPAQTVLLYDRVAGLELQHAAVDAELIERLVLQIEEQGSEQVEEAVAALFRHIRERRYAPEAVKMCIHQFVVQVVRTIRSMDGHEEKLASLTPMVGWQDLHLTPAELVRLTTGFAQECGLLIEKLRRAKSSGGIHKIKAYIDANYRDNLSLKGIATRFYMNPVYLGQLFKKTFGVYFNDYLLQLRLQEAKRMLRQTDLRVYEIAESVGFGSADYFVGQFEKQEGVTPTEYRNRLPRQDASKGADR